MRKTSSRLPSASSQAAKNPALRSNAIFDYDDFGDFQPGQYEHLSIVAKVARGIQEHGEAFAAWAQLHNADDNMLDAFEDNYLGEYDSPEDWAREFCAADQLEADLEKDLGPLASYMRFDAEVFARDAWLAGDIYVIHKDDGRCWVFASN